MTSRTDEQGMLKLIVNDDHLKDALVQAIASCRRRLFIATADVKDLHFPPEQMAKITGVVRQRAASIMEIFQHLCQRGVEVRIIHGGVPSGPFLGELKDRKPSGLTMRLCPRVHAKAVIADGRWMYLGSANLTGAGLGAKSPRRRNFEAGICTDQIDLIDPMLDMLDAIWTGQECASCGRKDHCPVPLEEPHL